MRKLVPIVLVLIMLMTVGISPNIVLADLDENMLSPMESDFIALLMAKVSEARKVLGGYRNVTNDHFRFASMVQDYPYINLVPKPFEGCGLPATSVPASMSDIAGAWRIEVCNEFGYMSSKIDSLLEVREKGAVPADDILIAMGFLKLTSDQIEASIAKIEALANERVEEFKRTREAAKEAEEEAKKELDLGDDFCFIATAAYGTATAEEINILRQFRDDFLRESSLGNDFINFYYWSSPPLADFIARHEVLRTIVREGLVDPVGVLVGWTQHWWQY